MTANDCVRCNRPTPDGYACPACAYRAGDQLHEIASHTGAARDVASGQAQRGSGGGSGKPGSRPPGDVGAMELLGEVQNDLVGWVRHIASERGGLTQRPGSDLIVHAARYLQANVEWMRHRPEVDEFLGDVERSQRRIRYLADGRQPGRYAGPCGFVDGGGIECREDVEARDGAQYATCRACGSRYNVEERQQWMRDEIEDHLARPVEIAGVLLRLGTPIGYSTIAAYAAKGQIVAHGSDANGKPLYRIGDVLDLRMGAKKPRRERELPRGAANPVGG